MATEVIDPVCGQHLDPVLAPFEAKLGDRMYYFCSDRCRDIFLKDPEKYANKDFSGAAGIEAHGEELEEPTPTR